jgi:CubicO group peptidase (beta-lactamase class C family)
VIRTEVISLALEFIKEPGASAINLFAPPTYTALTFFHKEISSVRHRLALASMCLFAASLPAQQLSPGEKANVDAAVQAAVEKTKVPSASVGIARGGVTVYAEATGKAVLPGTPATATMAYPIGSISKQFTAACILLLQEQGKLKLDDPVSKWFPEFTRASEVTIRNLLTHTSGYSDYAPQDYTIPAWTKPIRSYDLIREWATKPLDFDPGTKWQYSNTNFQMAALIIEKVSGKKYHDFLWANVIEPLKLEGVLDLDTDRDKLQVKGYEQHALGPMRPAILEAPGWYTGDGGLAMPASTLMQWDESLMHHALLKPASYDEMFAEYMLKDGTSSHYGLGVFSQERSGKRILSHSGEVGGFVSNNVVDVTDDVAYAALTNFEGPGASAVTTALREVLLPESVAGAHPASTPQPEQGNLPPQPVYDAAPATQAKGILTGLQKGRLDRGLFTADVNFYFSPETLHDFQASLAPLGAVESVTQVAEQLRGGMVLRVYQVKFGGGTTLSLNTYTQKDGRLEQFLVNQR